MGGGSRDIVRTVAAVTTGGLSEVAIRADEQLVQEPKKRAEEAARKQIEEQEQIEAVIKEEGKKEEAVQERNTARNKQKALSAKAAGRRSTILTSPLGVSGADDTSSRKTLLGQ